MGAGKGRGVPADFQTVEWIKCSYKANNYVLSDVPVGTIRTVEFDGTVSRCSDAVASLIYYRATDSDIRTAFFSNANTNNFVCAPVTPMSANYEGISVFTRNAGLDAETAPLYLFGGPTGSAARSRQISCKRFSINGGILFDGVPVYRKSDNAIGLYDLVAGKFCPAIGTFTKGADV